MGTLPRTSPATSPPIPGFIPSPSPRVGAAHPAAPAAPSGVLPQSPRAAEAAPTPGCAPPAPRSVPTCAGRRARGGRAARCCPRGGGAGGRGLRAGPRQRQAGGGGGGSAAQGGQGRAEAARGALVHAPGGTGRSGTGRDRAGSAARLVRCPPRGRAYRGGGAARRVGTTTLTRGGDARSKPTLPAPPPAHRASPPAPEGRRFLHRPAAPVAAAGGLCDGKNAPRGRCRLPRRGVQWCVPEEVSRP